MQITLKLPNILKLLGFMFLGGYLAHIGIIFPDVRFIILLATVCFISVCASLE